MELLHVPVYRAVCHCYDIQVRSLRLSEMTRIWLQMLSRRMRNLYDVNRGSLLSRIVCSLRFLLEYGVDIPFGFFHDGEMILLGIDKNDSSLL